MKNNNPKRKILKDRTFPGQDQINKHQDFERVIKEHSLIKKILMKKIIIWSGAIVGTAAITGMVLMNRNQDLPVKESAISPLASVENYIQPPIPGKDIQFSVYQISGMNGGVINYPTGSSITIPPGAFVNQNGEPVNDSVEIKYREFHDPLAIFLSGIPMRYDSAGISHTFESAGMMEIQAFDNGKPLSLDGKKPINVKMASRNNEERFNLYKLDTVKKNWVCLGKDKVEKPAEVQTEKNRKPAQAKVAESIQPALANPGKYSFRIAYDKNDFPELSAYDKVLFEVTDTNFKAAYYKISWNKISLTGGGEFGRYVIRLKKADTTISVFAKPVFDKADYSGALHQFEERHRVLAEEQNKKEQDEQARLDKLNMEIGTRNTNRMLMAASRMAGLLAYRSFPISSLGTYNSDYPMPPILAYAISIKRAQDNKKQSDAAARLAFSTIYVIEKGKNAVFRFPKGEPVRCNPNARKLMWTLTDKNEVAFFRITDYNKLSKNGENDITPVLARNQETALEEIRKFSE